MSAVPFTGGRAVRPQVFDIDLYEDQSVSGNNHTVDTLAVNRLHAQGQRAICYVDAGTWENWRPDAGRFPSSVLGKENGWPGERWLDVRQIQVLLSFMTARVGRCVQGGFDGVEFDNVDGYQNDTGFALTPADQLRYDSTLANMAHQQGLTVGLKNDPGQVRALLPYFDYAVNEQCQQYAECSWLDPFVASGKAVFQVEYSLSPNAFCPQANSDDRNAIMKSLDLYAEPWALCRST